VAAVERRGKVDQDRRDLVRVVGLALVTATVQGLAVANFGSGQAWPLGFLLAVLVCGVVGGLISANRWHVLTVCAGGAAGVIVAGVASDHGPLSPGELAAYLVLPASLDAGLLGLVGGPAHLVLRRVRAPLARLAAAGVLLVAIAASWVAFFGYLMASPAQIAGYRILDPQTIVVTAAGIPHGWTRVTAVAETESAVRIDASSSAWMWGPGTADLQNVELSVQLARPLDGRAVLNSAGQPVPLSELP
jgi:hypothetical protein